jgi:cytochrome c biogenesis protein CcdA
MKKLTLLFLIISAALLSSCATTFAGSVFVITFGDLVFYIVLALLMAFLISLKRSGSANFKRSFWMGFILSLLLTPLAGLIWLLILFTKKQN